MAPQPRSPTQTHVADEAASTGVDVRYRGAATTINSLEAGQGSANIDKTPTMPHDSPLLRVNTLGSDECSMTLQELMVKKLERAAKSSQARRRARIVVFDDEDDLEDPSKQGRKIDEIDQDPDISLVQHDAEIQGRHGHDMEFNFDVSTAEPVSTADATVTTASVAISTASPLRVSTTDDITMAETLVYIRRSAAKDKGKSKIDESKPVETKTKLQQEQERLGYEAVVRLQDQLDEEERQRIASVHELASSFNVEEWEDIQARIIADEELVQRAYQSEKEQLRGYSFDEIKALFETTMRRVRTFVPIESEDDKAVPELATRSSKRDTEKELDQESFKRRFTLKALGSTGRSLELEIILRERDGHLHAGREGAEAEAKSPLPPEAPVAHVDMEAIAKKERTWLEELLKSKGMPYGSYPRFTVAVKGQKVTIKFQIPPTCEITLLISNIFGNLRVKVEERATSSDGIARLG
ncbi:hypothetical protein Tco_0993258 [Tanacetum coccineum]|uniref:Uncharacterized protein n=1 Tax=Tanacetum coccineum TaxID=301880 RepID=A0ABQ5F5H7_9ASTR